MNISFDLYKVFYYVCKNRNITKAANELHVSQPAVSRHIKNLEGLLGVTLISKNSQGIELTKEGENLYLSIKDSVENFSNVEKSFRLKEKNYEYTIKIIANYSVIQSVLMDTIKDFAKLHPNVRFEMETFRYDIAFSKLRDAECDLVLLNYKKSMDEYMDIQVKTLYTVSDIFVVSKERRGDYPNVLSLENICDYPFICKERNAVSSANLISYLESHGKDFLPKYIINTDWLIESYVKKGFGIGLIPKDFVEDSLGKSLEALSTDVELPKRKICYAIRKNSVYYSILREFIQELKKHSKDL